MEKGRLLIVDDEKDMLAGLSRTLERQLPELAVVTADHGSKAIEIIKQESIDVVLLDICMPGITGMNLLGKLITIDPKLTLIMMTAYGTIEMAVEAMRKGAYDFITKPFEKDLLLKTIVKGLERNNLVRENMKLRQILGGQDGLPGFVGRSETMLNFYKRIETIAPSDYTVLIRGESGTGKELTAQSLHNLSDRKQKRFIPVNCPAIPEHLLESELFGYRRGAFTGADRDQKGLFVEADGGTICLDEIGDVSIPVQTKLLRVLQEQEIKPLGSVSTLKIDVRIIAVTSQDLERKIAERTFREDLFHRLNIVHIRTPSLSEIPEDIPLLVDYFVKKICCELKLPEKQFSMAAIQKLQHKSWSGNVRELQNAIRQVIMFSVNQVVEADELEFLGQSKQLLNGPQNYEFDLGNEAIEPYKMAKEQLLQKFKNEYIAILLNKTNGNVTQAAKKSGLTRAALHKIISRTKKNNLKKE